MDAAQDLVSELDHRVETDGNQFLTFLLAGEEYGVDILRVQEIKGWDSATPIPNTPEYIRGVINLRGTIVPIVDLRLRFGLEPVEYSPLTVVVMLKVVSGETSRIMGVVVDAVSDVYNVLPESLKDAPDFGSVVNVDFVKGLATVGDTMVIILDIDKLLNADGLSSIEFA